MTREEYYKALEKSKELYHHGVLGMKWGIRRSPEELGRRAANYKTENAALKLTLDNRDLERAGKLQRKVDKFSKKGANHKDKANKYQNKADKLYRKASKDKMTLSRENKQEKAAKYEHKAVGEYRKYEKYKNKANIWKAKVNQISEYRAQTEEKIRNNTNMINMYETTINQLNKGTVSKGLIFMQYYYDIDKVK